MKKVFILLVCVIVLTATFSLAMRIQWDYKTRPRVTLSQALDLAQKSLGSDADSFYCTGANLATTACTGGDWTLHYWTQAGSNRTVVVCMDGTVSVLKDATGVY
ncbi:MAG: hypothetical protein ACLP0A_15560 [Verrucomicrobiia bacterium]